MPARVAQLFPTFPMRDPEFRPDSLPGFRKLRDRWAERASALGDVTDDTFDPARITAPRGDLGSTLQAHYACFVEDVAMSEWLEERFPAPAAVAGYSMGLFPALVRAEAVSFEDGFRVMEGVCRAAHDHAEGTAYATGAVLGLPDERVEAEAERTGGAVEVTDVYAPGTVLVAGPAAAVEAFLERSLAQGAAETKLIPVTAPFHSTALRPLEGSIEALVRPLAVSAPRCPIVSAGTRRVLTDAEGVREELTRNVSRPMAWLATVEALLAMGVALFLEAGTSRRLSRMIQREGGPGEQGVEARCFADLAGVA